MEDIKLTQDSEVILLFSDLTIHYKTIKFTLID